MALNLPGFSARGFGTEVLAGVVMPIRDEGCFAVAADALRYCLVHGPPDHPKTSMKMGLIGDVAVEQTRPSGQASSVHFF